MGHLGNGAVSAYCEVSVDTRMALGDGDAGPRHAERRDQSPTRASPNVYEDNYQRRHLPAPSGYPQTLHSM